MPQPDRSLPFYATLGFQAVELPGYAVLRDDTTELHLSESSTVAAGGCLIRVVDARARWRSLVGQEMLGPLDDDTPGMVSFPVIDPDGNHLIFVGRS